MNSLDKAFDIISSSNFISRFIYGESLLSSFLFAAPFKIELIIKFFC